MSVATTQVASSAAGQRPFGRRSVATMPVCSPSLRSGVAPPSFHAPRALAPSVLHGGCSLPQDNTPFPEYGAVKHDGESCPALSDALAAFITKAGETLEGVLSSLKAQVVLNDDGPVETLARCWESLPAEAPFDAPARRLASARARLLTGEPRAVIDILDAATEDKRLLNLAARSVLKWLKENGGAHDTPQFRMFLMRTLRLSEAALEERSRPPQEESLQSDAFPTERVMERMRACLHDWQEDIREAWIIGRRCELLPEWPHWDVIVEVRPRALIGAEDVPARVEELRQAMRRALERIWLDKGSLGIHLHPVQVQHGLLSEVRGRGRPLFGTSRLYALDPERGGERKKADTDNNALPETEQHDTPLQEVARSVRTFLKRLTPPRHMRWGLVALGCLALSISAYRLFYANADTASKIALLEQHQKEIARKETIWRFEIGADAKDPAKTLDAYRLAMQAKDKSPLLPIYTENSRKAFHGRFPSLVAMEREWSMLTACGQPEIRMNGDHAIAVYPNAGAREDGVCLPRFLRKEGGRWRYDRVTTERIAPMFTRYVENVRKTLDALSRRDPQGRTFTLRTMHLPLELVPAAYLAAYRARPLPYTPAP